MRYLGIQIHQISNGYGDLVHYCSFLCACSEKREGPLKQNIYRSPNLETCVYMRMHASSRTKHRQKIINQLLFQAFCAGGFLVSIANSDHTKVQVGEIPSEKHHPFSIIFNDHIRISLRLRDSSSNTRRRKWIDHLFLVLSSISWSFLEAKIGRPSKDKST